MWMTAGVVRGRAKGLVGSIEDDTHLWYFAAVVVKRGWDGMIRVTICLKSNVCALNWIGHSWTY